MDHELAETGRDVSVIVYIPDPTDNTVKHFYFPAYQPLDAVVPLDATVVHICTRTIREQIRHNLEQCAIPDCVETMNERHEWGVYTWIDDDLHTWTVLRSIHKRNSPDIFLDMRRTGKRVYMSVRSFSQDRMKALAPDSTHFAGRFPFSRFHNFQPSELQQPIPMNAAVTASLSNIEQEMINITEQFGDYHTLKNNCQRHSVELQTRLVGEEAANLTRAMCFSRFFWAH